jgi:2-polyprenyl-3-methyl-5-hydroxy-6-metoxy-1,4-benzoquinol methylase
MFTGLGAGNIGDEAMFLAFLKHYPLPPGSTVEVYDPSSPVIKTLPRQYRYVDWRDDINNHQSIKSSRAALLVGGTPVAAEWGLDWPLRALADRLRFCHAEGIPVHAVGVGVDSLYDEAARQIFIDAFRPIASWTVRSSNCRAALLDLGVPSGKIAVTADLAWLFSPDIADRTWAEDFWKSLGIDVSKPLLGVNVVNERWAGCPEVKRAIATALDRLVAGTEIQVVFLCNETREGDYYDACAAREVIGMMNRESVLVPNFYFTPSQMIELLSFCTITLSQRYHFTIFSILAGIVPLSFSRGQKMASLLEELGEEPVGTMEACRPEYLEEQIHYVLSHRADVRTRRQSAAGHQKERAEDNFKFIKAISSAFPLSPRLATVSELHSDRFREFMKMLNSHAGVWGLRTFINWSKIWEYPWLWFNGLNSLDWSRIKVLDLGSELSPMPWLLASLGASVTLVEQDDQWLPQWQRLAEETGFKVDWRIVKDERLPFQSGSFDVVTSFSVLEHQCNKHLAIDEVARVLKPGGIFAISFDICEPDMGMTFPEWNGKALTMGEFEQLVWQNPAWDNGGGRPDWNVGDCAEFIRWHRQSAPYHNYTVGAALVVKKSAV